MKVLLVLFFVISQLNLLHAQLPEIQFENITTYGGLPEQMNDSKEMYGYKSSRNLFEEIAGHSPEDIITKLKDAGSEWVNGNDPDDDMTFVVIKVK